MTVVYGDLNQHRKSFFVPQFSYSWVVLCRHLLRRYCPPAWVLNCRALEGKFSWQSH